MATEKLYWQDPLAFAFETEGATVGRFQDRASVVLDRTMFYAEAGGQLADTGTLQVGSRALRVADVQIDDDGVIHHLVDGLDTAAPLDGPVRGRVDEARRRDHAVQHTAQHMLSRALLDEARAETASARLGATTCTLDVSRPHLDERELHRAEDLVNAAVRADVDVRALFPTPEELAALLLRRAPKVTTGVRVIDIEGFDVSPCGGTHCTRTGQIGVVRIVGVEKYKGMTRVTFHAGARATADMRDKERVLGELARDFTCGALDVPLAVAKLRGDLKARLDALSATRGELVAFLAERALAASPLDPSGTTRVVMVRQGDDLSMLRTLAGRLSARPDVVAICAAPEEGGKDLAIVVQRGETATFDCGAWLKRVAAEIGGRGGGRPERAEGRLPRSADLHALATWAAAPA